MPKCRHVRRAFRLPTVSYQMIQSSRFRASRERFPAFAAARRRCHLSATGGFVVRRSPHFCEYTRYLRRWGLKSDRESAMTFLGMVHHRVKIQGGMHQGAAQATGRVLPYSLRPCAWVIIPYGENSEEHSQMQMDAGH